MSPANRQLRSRYHPAANKRIILIIDTARAFDRELLLGVRRYSRLHGPWKFHVVPENEELSPKSTKSQAGTGVIARLVCPKVTKAVLALNAPTIALGDWPTIRASGNSVEPSCIWTDLEGAARLAARHLVERGFQQFAFVGEPDRITSVSCFGAFRDAIGHIGCDLIAFHPPKLQQGKQMTLARYNLTRWVRELPKPIGLLACSDELGILALEACRLARVKVPSEIAVVGVGNDELLCEMADPPLSSVALNTKSAGYCAAHLLDHIMRRGTTTSQLLVVEPTHLVARSSTDVCVTDGPELSTALDMIRRHCWRDFSVADLVATVGVSRRRLETRFRKCLGTTILTEVQRARLARAKTMLQETEEPIAQVAASSGYRSVSYLTQVFGREIGMTPARYRALCRTELGGRNDAPEGNRTGSTRQSGMFL